MSTYDIPNFTPNVLHDCVYVNILMYVCVYVIANASCDALSKKAFSCKLL